MYPFNHPSDVNLIHETMIREELEGKRTGADLEPWRVLAGIRVTAARALVSLAGRIDPASRHEPLPVASRAWPTV